MVYSYMFSVSQLSQICKIIPVGWGQYLICVIFFAAFCENMAKKEPGWGLQSADEVGMPEADFYFGGENHCAFKDNNAFKIQLTYIDYLYIMHI